MDEAAGLEPLGPFVVARTGVYEVAGMQDEARVGRRRIGLADQPRPVRGDAVLGIAHVDELDRALERGRPHLKPFAPHVRPAALNPVGIEGVGLQPREVHRVMAHRRDALVDGQLEHLAGDLDLADVEGFAHGRHRFRTDVEAGVGAGLDDLSLGRRHRGIGAPVDGMGAGRIAVEGDHDTVGPGRGLLPGRQMVAVMSLGGKAHGQNQRSQKRQKAPHDRMSRDGAWVIGTSALPQICDSRRP